MNLIDELREQIKELRRQQERIEDMIQEAHNRIDQELQCQQVQITA